MPILRLVVLAALAGTLGGCSGEMVANYIIDHIPWWGWVMIFAVPAGVLLYFTYPILIPIWRAIPLPVRVGLIGVIATIIGILGGRYRGRANAEEAERQRNAEALRKRAKVEDEVNRMSGTDAEKRLRDRWTRPPS